MVFKHLLRRWKHYRYRFVPWIAFNFKDRGVRSVPKGKDDRIIPDAEIKNNLLWLFSVFYEHDPVRAGKMTNNVFVAQQNLQLMHDLKGFTLERQPSTILNGGIGVVVTQGSIPKGAITSLYPGLIYERYDPVFFQSLKNSFIFRCIDGVLIDGNDKGISKYLYRSCQGRDKIGPYDVCDASWLSPCLLNPLAIGQYVNNHNKDNPPNVAYQEFNVPTDFPFHLRKYLPNNFYSSSCAELGNYQRLTRIVALVALRDIACGEELFSSYFTIVH